MDFSLHATEHCRAQNLPDLKAQRCIASDPIGTLELVGEPACDKQTTTIEGQSSGVNTSSSNYLPLVPQKILCSIRLQLLLRVSEAPSP